MDQVYDRKLRGLTLLEVLIAGAVFSAMMLAVLAVYKTALGARAREEEGSATYRAAMLAIEHVQSLLRGSQVVEPSDPAAPPATRAVYRPSLRENGRVKVDSGGVPVWGDPVTLRMDAAGNLVREEPSGIRILAPLGPSGSVAFRLLDPRMLEVRVVAARTNPSTLAVTRSLAECRLTLPNQP
ncbi:MAG: type II secretion system protein [Candidatus Eremiobacterota bacterium]